MHMYDVCAARRALHGLERPSTHDPGRARATTRDGWDRDVQTPDRGDRAGPQRGYRLRFVFPLRPLLNLIHLLYTHESRVQTPH